MEVSALEEENMMFVSPLVRLQLHHVARPGTASGPQVHVEALDDSHRLSDFCRIVYWPGVFFVVKDIAEMATKSQLCTQTEVEIYDEKIIHFTNTVFEFDLFHFIAW